MTAPVQAEWMLWPALVHVGLIVALYVWLTVARFLAVRRGETAYGAFEFGKGEPSWVARITRNLANQFELPVLFYFAAGLLIAMNDVLVVDVAAGWVFVAGRLIHTGVQTLTSNVPLRGRVFMIGFLAVWALLAHLAVLALGVFQP